MKSAVKELERGSSWLIAGDDMYRDYYYIVSSVLIFPFQNREE